MSKKTFIITEDQFERIYRHSYNLYNAIEEMYEDFSILYNTLEQIKANPNNLKPKITNIYKKKF